MNICALLGSIFLTSFIPKNEMYYLLPGGDNIVFDIKLDGLVITGGYNIRIENEVHNPLTYSDLRIGDTITSIEGFTIDSIESFMKYINNTTKNEVELGVIRGDTEFKRKLKLVYEDNTIKTGLYVKNDVYGVGTISYIDPNNNTYGALGHEVIDEVTKKSIRSRNGKSYYENVIKINKGKTFHPGSKESEVTLNNLLGNINMCNQYGLFGNISDKKINRKKMMVARKDEIKLGEASVRTSIRGNIIEEFKIRITNINKDELDKSKGLMFEIVDPSLIEVAGGVYSGMSGSPIIQNNKLIGVVTHVINANINKGYALYIDTMYNHSSK